eukprot:3784605-Rhodomonas_salina.1
MPGVLPEDEVVLRPGQVRETGLEAVTKAVVRHETLARRWRYEAEVPAVLEPRLADERVVHLDAALTQPPQVPSEGFSDLDPRHRHPRDWCVIPLVVRVVLLPPHEHPHVGASHQPDVPNSQA